jgi:hypothetical protein
MPHVLLTAKLFYLYLYNGLMSFVMHAILQATGDTDKLFVMVLIFFGLFGIMLPEFCLMFFPGFRAWIKQGVEDADGLLNKSDLQDAAIIYVSLWFMRVSMAFSVAMMYGIEIKSLPYILTILASFGLAGLTVIKHVVKR